MFNSLMFENSNLMFQKNVRIRTRRTWRVQSARVASLSRGRFAVSGRRRDDSRLLSFVGSIGAHSAWAWGARDLTRTESKCTLSTDHELDGWHRSHLVSRRWASSQHHSCEHAALWCQRQNWEKYKISTFFKKQIFKKYFLNPKNKSHEKRNSCSERDRLRATVLPGEKWRA